MNELVLFTGNMLPTLIDAPKTGVHARIFRDALYRCPMS
jgi:hypothetical protein